MSTGASSGLPEKKIVRIADDGRTLEFVELLLAVPDNSTRSGCVEALSWSYTFKDRSVLEEACTIKFLPFKKDGRTFRESHTLPKFQDKLAVVGDREIGAILTRQFYRSGAELPTYNEIVTYGVSTNRYMAHQALRMQLLDCMMCDGRAVATSDCDISSLRDLHLAATCVEAIVGAVWADSEDTTNCAQIVAEVMHEFLIYFPAAGSEETALLCYLDYLRDIEVLREVGSCPEKGFFVNANC